MLVIKVDNKADKPSKCFYWVVSLCLCIVTTRAVAPVARGLRHAWVHSSSFGYETDSKESRWAEAALNFLHSQDCKFAPFTNTKNCELVVKLPRESISVHLATTSPYGRYQVNLPDERVLQGEVHDAVLVLDLFPETSFGHLVLVFYIDTGLTRVLCQRKSGLYLDHGECMQMAQRRRCRNAMELRFKKRNFANKCEINFLPVVHLETDKDFVKKNLLQCRNDILGYHKCPDLRPVTETSRLLCDPLMDNVQTCATTHGSVRTSCKVFEICDQAVILSGGWNRETAGLTYEDNVAKMYQLLRRNGFKRRHIKVFYANGKDKFEVPGESPVNAHPSAMKVAIRNHLQRMCASPHCVDSLVLYLNSPTTHDGTMLLWDVNGDGLAEDGDKYTIKEFLKDIADCSAKQIQVLVDSSYSGELVNTIKQSGRHGNVIVMASGEGDEYSYQHEFTGYWSSLLDTRTCTVDAHMKSHESIVQSSPVISNKDNIPRVTLSGAPCDVRPPFTNKELKRDYFGCQNLPTAVWLQKILQGSGKKRKISNFR